MRTYAIKIGRMRILVSLFVQKKITLEEFNRMIFNAPHAWKVRFKSKWYNPERRMKK